MTTIDQPDPVVSAMHAYRDIFRNPSDTSGDYNYGRTRDALRSADPDRLKHAADYLAAYDPTAAIRADASHDNEADPSPREKLLQGMQDMWKSDADREYEGDDGHGNKQLDRLDGRGTR